MQDFLSTPQGIWTVVGGCLVLGVLFAVARNLRVKERKHFSDLAGALTSAGVPEVFTTPISDLAVGDGPGFIGAVVKAAQQLRSTDGWLSLVKGVYASAMNDPARKAALAKLLADLQSGASDSVLSADLQSSYSANPLSKVIGTGPLATDLGNIASRIQTITNNPALASIGSAISSLPQDIQTHVLAIADAVHTAATAAAKSAPVVAAVAAPAVAPAVAPVAAVAGAVAAGVHTAVVTSASPISVTPAAPAAPATPTT